MGGGGRGGLLGLGLLLKPGLVFTENGVDNTKSALQVLANKIWSCVCVCVCVCGGGGGGGGCKCVYVGACSAHEHA